MIPLTRNTLLAVGIVFHLVYLCSIFDIYFRSPLIHGMTPVSVDEPPPAKRLALFVADGLRADKIFEPHTNPADPALRTLAPYLMDIVHSRGSWGVSHTRVPTESRPGHVAVIAGFYEDVSAVTKGWKMNPVEFDSIFNQSRHTWSFGSPDILPMFAHGASDPDKVDTFMYPHEFEEFHGDAYHLDEWVFDRAHKLFTHDAAADPDLHSALNQDKIIIFIHLLGLDTNGHTFKPYSAQYYNNIYYVDQGIKRIVDRIEDFYGHDASTAYIFTADHGMGDLGAHGDGHPDNTRTPLIAWGAGIAPARKVPPGLVAPGHDSFSRDWDHTTIERRDVNQADIAPLMAALIGVPFPLNSVGTLPLDYLDASPEFKAKAAFANAKQILAQYLLKHDQKRRSELHFVPYAPLHLSLRPVDVRLAEIDLAIRHRDYELAEHRCSELIQLCLEGLRYFQRYDWLLLRSIVSAGYIGWIMYSLAFIIQAYVLPPSSSPFALSSSINKLLNALALGVLLAFWAVFFYQHSPPLYYAYVLFPVYFWLEVIKQMAWVREALSVCLTSSRPKWHLPALVVVYVGMLEAMVYGYFDRRLYSLELILMGLGWVLSLPRAFRASHALAIAGWIAGCVVTAIFTMLPVLKAKSAELALSGGLAITLSGLAIFSQRGRFIFPASDQNYTQTAAPKVVARIARRDSALLLFQVAVIGVSTVVVYITQCSIDSGNKSSLPSRWLLWTILLASPAVPFVQLSYYKRLDLNPHFLHRLVSIYLAFATPFIILSISYEPWFYLCFSGVLMMWLAMERASYQFDLEMSLAAPTSQALGYQLATPSYAAPVAGGNRNTNGRYKRTYNVIIDEADDNKETQASLAGESSLQQQQQQQPKHRPLTVRDARTALFFLLFISIAFFGTGNVASMASFNLSSVFRLVTVFRPFLMAVILIFKILIPFILLSAVFGVLNQCLNLPPFSLFLVVLSTTDIMTLNFFFLVRDEGSWLDIGMSISHFCISSLFVLLSIVLFVLSHVLVGRVLVAQPLSSYRDKKRT